jgi:outer membrane immunogenic protein
MQRTTIALLAAAALGAGVANNAFAYDILSSKPVAYWTGFYIGGNFGYGWGRGTISANGGGTVVAGSENVDGILGGAQVGGNIQSGRFVFGFESDIQFTDQQVSSSFISGATRVTATDKLPWFGTTRLRAGYAGDRWLAYGTAGVAYGQFKSDAVATGAFNGSYSYSTTRFGWVVGAGLEAYVDNNFSWKIEYLHLDSGTISSVSSAGLTSVTTSAKLTDDILRFGVNYKLR